MTIQEGATVRVPSVSRRLSWASRAGLDDGVAMVVTVMMMLVMASLSILMLGLVLSQVAPTQFAQKNTTTIFAAEAGVEAALGRIRTSVGAPDFTGAVFGNSHELPCFIDGKVDALANPTSYGATIWYFSEDPSGRDETWLLARKMACSDPGGTGSVQPAFALITSEGATSISSSKVATASGQRAISMVYRFETTTTNISGGRIYSWNGTATPQFCLRADGTAENSTVSYRAVAGCGAATNDETELWVYDTDYTLKLASSTLTVTPLCMTNDSGTIKLKACGTPTNSQLWSWDQAGRATWVGQNASTEDSGSCLFSGVTSGSPAAGSKLKVGSCASQSAWGSFSPDPAVGPGAASVNTHQIVNYLEFGRCFDVTDTDVGKDFMISYPCKQDPPAGANLFWNHKWFYTEPLVGTTAPAQLIYVYKDNSLSQKYCLRTATGLTDPSSTGVDSAYHVTLTNSCSSTAPAQQWTRSTDTGNKVTSYTIRDSSGRCVGVGGGKYNGNWSALVVSTCNGSTAQKWNAPSDSVEAAVGNYLEETG